MIIVYKLYALLCSTVILKISDLTNGGEHREITASNYAISASRIK